jgi:hypothetical protein
MTPVLPQERQAICLPLIGPAPSQASTNQNLPIYLHGGEKALEVLPVQLPINGAAAALRWKSQRIKSIGYEFSIDF